MRRVLPLVLIAASFALPAVASAAPAPKAVGKANAGKNWLTTTSRTAEGAIVVGNPAAKVKLIEYLSLTCSHCAQLSAEMTGPLQRDYIGKGLVSLEVRHAVRDGYDFVASLLLRCQAPARYIDGIHALFAVQPEWMARGVAAREDPAFESRTPDEKLAIIARTAGFDTFFAKRGMTAPAFAACLGDAEGKQTLSQMASNSWQRDAIPGTPLILLNGVRQESVHRWADLEPLIRTALQR